MKLFAAEGAGNTETPAKPTDADAAAATAKAASDKAAADTKAAADKVASDKAAADAETVRKAAEAAAKAKAPEKYELTLPEGDRLDDGDLKYIETVARANNWSNEDAQAAITEHDAAIKAQSERFLADTKADKDYGGDKLVETERLAKAAIAKIRPEGHARRESFLRFLNRGGAGNHIEALSFLADLGRLMGEDGAGAGGGSGGGKAKTAEEILYPGSTT